MPHRQAHENASKMVLGYKYTIVHRWLDGTFTRRKWRTHRIDRHHLDAINKKFKEGSGQYKAAILHVLCDFMMSFNLICIPKDRNDVKRIFIEHGVM